MSSSEVASITKQATAAQEAKPIKRICCACPDTKRLRDECIAEHGPEDCGKLIEAHLRCLRAEGFNKEKKPKPMAGLVPDMVGDKPSLDASELCRAWGKVSDQTVLIFFDSNAKANFISLELASKLGIRPKEMGYTAEAGLACSCHSESVTPIIGKLRLHIQFYVAAEEFYIMPLAGCNVLLGIPWMFRVKGIMDAYNKKIIVQHMGKTHILDVKLKGKSVPTVSASAITSVMKHHLFPYLLFARGVLDNDQSNLSVLDKERAMFSQQFSDCFSD
ncbi:hypothetical protein L7F22_053589 [Adiantum nelumboides]|nr:hypothetical protein [Adiantum nelumboides]